MSAGLVKNNSAEAVAQNYSHFAGWRIAAIDHSHSSITALAGLLFKRVVVEKLIPAHGSGRNSSGLLLVILCRYRLNRESDSLSLVFPVYTPCICNPGNPVCAVESGSCLRNHRRY